MHLINTVPAREFKGFTFRLTFSSMNQYRALSGCIMRTQRSGRFLLVTGVNAGKIAHRREKKLTTRIPW